MFRWFKRSLTLGFTIALEMNRLQRRHIKLLERKCELQEEAIRNLENMLRTNGKEVQR